MSLVEYHDPDGLFPLVAPKLQERLPLRNLHWKSPSRPLRSIASLNVEFVPASNHEGEANGSNNHLGNGQSSGGVSVELSKNQLPLKARKHQIPGLRSTPFLKLLILRCDDKEAYKAVKKQQVKDWLQTYVPQWQKSLSSASRQENHDAHEWLVLHVVLPGTQAASQPRWSKASAADAEVPKEKSSSSKWPGRGSSSVLDRLRSDFNESGKHALDHIAQVRLSKQEVPSHLSPAKPGPGAASSDETQQDADNAWADLVSKFKSLILTAFGARVGQYEDDIREKEAQKSLPGWNFCTFFVLKEGLLRALESVGLVEDALIGYDELAAGLDTTLEVLRNPDSNQPTSDSFLENTPELRGFYDELASRPPPQWGRPISPIRKEYRELIASNKVSIFDFRCYIFSRQMGLLLHLVNPAAFQQLLTDEASSAKLRDFQPIGNVEDAFALADLLQRSGKFVTGVARLIREDLDSLGSVGGNSAAQRSDMVVYSWAFAAAHQILQETSSPSFPQPESRKPKRVDAFPSRRSSLAPQARAQLDVKSVDVIGEEESFGLPSNLNEISAVKNVELASAAALRADLFLVQRRMLEHAGRLRGLSSGQALNGTPLPAPSDSEEERTLDFSRVSTILELALSSPQNFKHQYQNLTDRAIWYFLLSGRRKSAERLSLDLARLKYHEGDFAGASAYFTRMISSNASSQWFNVETDVLHMHADCLKALNRKDDHIRIMMLLISKSLTLVDGIEKRDTPKTRQQPSGPKQRREGSKLSYKSISELFESIVAYSRQLTYEHGLTLDRFFPFFQVAPRISHLVDRDGFSLDLTLCQIISDNLTIDSVMLRLISDSDDATREVLIESKGPHELSRGQNVINLFSNVNTHGCFTVASIKVCIGKLAFVQEVSVKPVHLLADGFSALKHQEQSRKGRGRTLMLWPRNGSPIVSVCESPFIHVGQRRSLEISIREHQRDVKAAEIFLHAATASLRIHTAVAEARSVDQIIHPSKTPGAIKLDGFKEGQVVRIEVPYDLDGVQPAFRVKLELHYETSQGQFITIADTQVDTRIAMAVNVQDIFKHQMLTSSFQLRSADDEPLKLLSSQLESSENFVAHPVVDMGLQGALTSGQQPVTSTFRIAQIRGKGSGQAGRKPASRTLSFKVTYLKIQQLIARRLVDFFKLELHREGYDRLENLLIPHLHAWLCGGLTMEALSVAAESGEITVPDGNQINWEAVLQDLEVDEQTTVDRWLRQWHMEHPVISLPEPSHTEQDVHTLVLDFEVPQLPRLFTTSVYIISHAAPTTSGALDEVATVGRPLNALVTIESTTQWSSVELRDQTQKFRFQLQTDAAVWGILGPKQQVFDASEDKGFSTVVTMIPLVAGELPMPHVDVQPFREHLQGLSPYPGFSYSGVSPGSGQGTEMVIETDCLTQYESVVVAERMKSTTVGAGRADRLAASLDLLESEPAIP